MPLRPTGSKFLCQPLPSRPCSHEFGTLNSILCQALQTRPPRNFSPDIDANVKVRRLLPFLALSIRCRVGTMSNSVGYRVRDYQFHGVAAIPRDRPPIITSAHTRALSLSDCAHSHDRCIGAEAVRGVVAMPPGTRAAWTSWPLPWEGSTAYGP